MTASPATIAEKISKDITDAMRARDEHRLTTLRMVKSALKNKEIEKRGSIEQRKDSVEQFTKGGRQELAEKEALEIKMIEGYMPAAVGEAEVVAAVRATITEMGAPTMKDMGSVMKAVMAKFQGSGARVDGKLVSEAVKRELTPK
jgi:uncharacterized protein YqeY